MSSEPEVFSVSTRFWSHHWSNKRWRPDFNPDYTPLFHTAGNSFSKRGVVPGDVVYVISISKGHLFLGGRMIIDKILGAQDAMEVLRNSDLFDAKEHLIGKVRNGTPLNLHRRLSADVSKQLRFKSKTGDKELCFVSETELNNQGTRGVRELSADSAKLLDRVIDSTDRLPRSGKLVTVTQELLEEIAVSPDGDAFRLPEEVHVDFTFLEGGEERVEIKRFERDQKARAACIEAHGLACCICGIRFGEVYGAEAERFIHVHHLRPLSEVGGQCHLDPVRDLRPVCPNCHAVLHLGGQCRTIEYVRQLLIRQGRIEPDASTDCGNNG